MLAVTALPIRLPTAVDTAFAPRAAAAGTAIALMFSAPLAVLPSASNPFVFPKLFMVALALAAAAIAVTQGRLPAAVWAIVMVGATAFTVASFFGVARPSVGLIGRWPRYEGLPVLAIYLGAAWAGARLLGHASRRQIDAAHRWAAISALALATFSVLDALGLSPLGWTGVNRTGSLLGNATDQGLLAVIYVAILIAPAIGRLDSLSVLGVVGSLATVCLSGSRTAILATGLVLLIYFVAIGRRNAFPIASALFGLGALAILLPQSRRRLLEGQTIESRILAWKETLALARDHWLLGVGPSGYEDAIGRYQDAEWVRVVGTLAKPDSPHSWPLQALAAGGLPLLTAALALSAVIGALGVAAVRSAANAVDATRGNEDAATLLDLRIGLLAAVGAYGVALLVNFTTPSTTCLAAFATGALIAKPPKAKEPTTLRAFPVVAAVCASLLFAVMSLSEVALRNGAELASAGRTRLATERFEVVERLRPFDPDASMLSAQYLAQQASRGSLYAARQTARRARTSLASTPDSYESNVALGVALIARRELRDAAQVLDHAVSIYPYRPHAYIQRAIARAPLGDIDGAVADLQRAHALDPSDPMPKILLTDLKRRLDASAASSRKGGRNSTP